MEISELIVQRMAEKQLSGRRLSKLLGVHPQTIVWWRTGRRVPQTQNILSLAAALEIEPEELLKSSSLPTSVN